MQNLELKYYAADEKKGFALAEVLVTLVIIGILATLVIPGLFQSTQNVEFVLA